MYKFEGFKLEDGRWLAWKDELTTMGAFYNLGGKTRDEVLRQIPGAGRRTIEIDIYEMTCRVWFAWGVRDGVPCVQLRVTPLYGVGGEIAASRSAWSE